MIICKAPSPKIYNPGIGQFRDLWRSQKLLTGGANFKAYGGGGGDTDRTLFIPLGFLFKYGWIVGKVL